MTMSLILTSMVTTMSKFVYCSHCGTKLPITRRAMPKYNIIVEIIPPHECSEEVVPFDVKPNPAPTMSNDKFIQKLNELNPLPEGSTPSFDPGDRRPKDIVKDATTAPKTLLDVLKSQTGD